MSIDLDQLRSAKKISDKEYVLLKEYIEYRNVDPTSSRRTHKALHNVLWVYNFSEFHDIFSICKCILEDNYNRPKEEKFNKSHILKIINYMPYIIYDVLDSLMKNYDLTRSMVIKIIKEAEYCIGDTKDFPSEVVYFYNTFKEKYPKYNIDKIVLNLLIDRL